MRDSWSIGWSYVLPLLAGAIVRLAWIAVNPHQLVEDEVPYHELATSLAQGAPYGVPFWPPGYPLILGFFYRLFGSSVSVAIGLNFVASLLTVAIVGALAHDLFGSRTARLSMWLTALMPSYILAIVLVRYEVLMRSACWRLRSG
jgi:4-amino-4-deoxy-L-arabinose transferase-like glycosyltransferase